MITGNLTSVSVAPARVGEMIKATVGFSALNPGALYWKTFLVVDSPALNVRKVLDAAREIGQEGGRTKTYVIGVMPDSDVPISFFLFAHDDAGYDWRWDEYLAWYEGFSTQVTYLGSYYSFLSPVSLPVPDPVPAPVNPQTMEVDITPAEGGYVQTYPAPASGINRWTDGSRGLFPYGELVYVTAYPAEGYLFQKWTDEIEGGVSYSNPDYVKRMTEHRAVKAHFVTSEPEPGLPPPSPPPPPGPGPSPTPTPTPSPTPGLAVPNWLLPAGVAVAAVLLFMNQSKPGKRSKR